MDRAPVWIVSAEHWPRAMLRAELIERGFDAIGYVSVVDALLVSCHPTVEKPAVVILDLNEIDVTRAQRIR
jgi:hypothetical protein